MDGITLFGRFTNVVLFFFVTIFFDSVSSWGTRLEATNHISGWIQMKSNDNSLSQALWNHNLNEIPVRVDIQVKPVSGSDTGYFFPGVASAQREGVVQSPYGGIVYKYNKTTVMMFAPNKVDGHSPGYAIFTGGKVWNGPKAQQESDVHIRIRVWGEQHFPQPDLSTIWKPLRIGMGFQYVPHNIGVQPQFVVVQIKLGKTEDIADGIGYLMPIKSRQSFNNFGGVLYGYDSKSINLWANFMYGKLFTITEGWGKSNEGYKSGFYRVFAWKSLKELKMENKSIPIPTATKKSNEISLQGNVDQVYDIVQVMIKEMSPGANNGYLLKATGAVQNVQNSSYGGAVYSYSSHSVRIWYPPVQKKNKQYLVYIDKMYGGSSHTSVAEKGELEISIFKPHITVTTAATTKSSTQTITTPSHTTLSAGTTTTKRKAVTQGTLGTTVATKRSLATTLTQSSTALTQSSTAKGKVTKDNIKTKAVCDYGKNGHHWYDIESKLREGPSKPKETQLKLLHVWIWIAIGFCSCLIIVIVAGFIWYCIKRRSNHTVGFQPKPQLKEAMEVVNKTETSIPKHEAWQLDFV